MDFINIRRSHAKIRKAPLDQIIKTPGAVARITLGHMLCAGNGPNCKDLVAGAVVFIPV